ncbi:MAG: phosphodiesterase [Defluviitaleaceae bacterium]|nr:phosphodiesterase [Defluviitaleaceae bacterium]
MKLLIASDIHGSLKAAKLVIEIFNKEEADYLLFLGDIMYHGPRNPQPAEYSPAEVAKSFNEIACYTIAVRGNCDSEVDQMLLNFPINADYQNIILGKNKLFATHGHIYELNNLPKNLQKGDVFAFGHIHVPILEERDGIIILNPGSASLPKENNPPTYAILDDKKIEIKTFEEKILSVLHL